MLNINNSLFLKKTILKYPIFIFLILFLCSCASKKDIIYLQDISNKSKESIFQNLNIQPGDILDIQISSLNPESIKIFQPEYAFNFTQNSLDVKQSNGYLVDNSGQIVFPLIGKLKTSGTTCTSFGELLQGKLSSFIKSPTVKVRIINFKISVLGEVRNPGTFNIIDERINISQALGLAGDLTINGDRNNIKIIRNENEIQSSTIIDITDASFLQSPYYYLKQNDIIYVSPNTAKVKSSGIIGNVGTLTSVLSLILSLSLVLTR